MAGDLCISYGACLGCVLRSIVRAYTAWSRFKSPWIVPGTLAVSMLCVLEMFICHVRRKDFYYKVDSDRLSSSAVWIVGHSHSCANDLVACDVFVQRCFMSEPGVLSFLS